MKFIHSADFHLCRSMSTSQLSAEAAREHRRQLFRTFADAALRCQSEKADIWLIAGDLFESGYAAGADFKRAADVFAGIPNTRVFISCGNHDFLAADSFYNSVPMPANVTVFPPELTCVPVEEAGCAVWGFSWNKNRYDSVPFTFPSLERDLMNILCLHCDTTSGSPYMYIPPDDLAAAGFDYAALGHIHKYTNLSHGLIYPGSPEPLDFGESGKHGMMLGEFTKQSRTVKFINTARREFVTAQLAVTAEDSHEELIRKTAEALAGHENDFIRLTLKGRTDMKIDMQSLSESLAGRFYSLTVKDATRPDYDVNALLCDNRDNIIGRYIAALAESAQNEPEAREALRLGLEALLEQKGGARK